MIRLSIFPGESQEVVLVIAGVHGSELSGIEVAHWLRVFLQADLDIKPDPVIPVYTTIIVPEVFPESAELARQCNATKKQRRDKDLEERCDLSENGREVVRTDAKGTKFTVFPQRQFPPPGQPLSHLEKSNGPADPAGQPIKFDTQKGKVRVPLLEGTRELLQLIELVKPVRIVSLHAHIVVDKPEKGTDAPGIFVDPRYAYDVKTCQENPVDPAHIHPFGTNPCKFDLIKDPAFPIVGLFQMLNEVIAKKNQNDPTVQSAKKHIETARKDVTQALPELKQALSDLGLDFDKDYQQKKKNASARTQLGRAEDDTLAFHIAQIIKNRMHSSDLVPGNHLNDPPEVLHYAASKTPPAGFSLGDWGPVKVGNTPKDSGFRPGAPVYTFEIFKYDESGAFAPDRNAICLTLH